MTIKPVLPLGVGYPLIPGIWCEVYPGFIAMLYPPTHRMHAAADMVRLTEALEEEPEPTDVEHEAAEYVLESAKPELQLIADNWAIITISNSHAMDA